MGPGFPAWRRWSRPAAAVVITFAATNAGAEVLCVPHIPQKGELWCWAAAAEMARDFLFKSEAQAVGQCTLAREVPLNPECKCPEPDDYLYDKDCAKATPYGQDDYMRRLLVGASVQADSYNSAPISKELLACEIRQRKAPVIFWWRNGACVRDGHLVVASGVEGTPFGDFVLALDPWPHGEGGGEVYWLSWRGFACGRFGNGHCVSYYNLQGARRRAPCSVSTMQDATDCFAGPSPLETIADLDDVGRYVGELLKGRPGRRLRRALRIPMGRAAVDCDSRLLFREAVPALVGAQVSYQRTQRTRVLCTVKVGSRQYDASAMLFASAERAPSGSYSFVGLGRGAWTDWVKEQAQLMLPQNVAAADTLLVTELVELFVPGRGQLLLIDDRGAQGVRAIRYGGPPGGLPRSLDAVLEEQAFPGGPTVGAELRGWAAAGG
jgi:hypothetical protein